MLFRHSLIRRSGLALAIISLVALVNIGLSLGVAHSIQGSATAINVAGSLRKQSFRMLSDWYETLAQPGRLSRAQRLDDVQSFGQRLHHPALRAAVPRDEAHPASRQFRRVTTCGRSRSAPCYSRHPGPRRPHRSRQRLRIS